MKFVAIDFETTGLRPKTNRAIEIGLVRFSEAFEIEEEFSTLIDPGRDVGRTDIHGITPTMLAGAPRFEDLAAHVCEFISNSILVAHNKRFDLDFLATELARVGIELPSLDAICTIELIRSAHPSSPRRLHDACRFLGIEPENAHEALADARMAAQIAMTVLRDDGFPALPEPVRIELPQIFATPVVKTRQDHRKTRPHSYLADLVKKLPETAPVAGREAVAANEYLNLLDRVIEDRIIDEDDAALLTMLAGNLGLSASSVRILHSSYLYALCRTAQADGHVTDSERRDIQIVAEALALEGWEELLEKDIVDQAPTTTVSRSMPAGTRVCFTGQMDLTRSECEDEARRKGFIVCPGVTKDLDVLVVADPRTQSSKAQKARKYGARIISERAFFREIANYRDAEEEADSSQVTFSSDEIIIQVGGQLLPLSAFTPDEVDDRERELEAGFAEMMREVSPAILQSDEVRERLSHLASTSSELSDRKSSVEHACDTARVLVLDLWCHVRALRDEWVEPTPAMEWSFERLEEALTNFFSRSQAVVEARENREVARDEVVVLITRTVENFVSYEPRARHSALYLREKDLRERGVIPNETLAGISIVVSGDFIEFERDEAYRAIQERGGKSPGSVSGRTYALLAGEHAGWAKLEKSLERGVPVIGFAEFVTILDAGALPNVPKRNTDPKPQVPVGEVIEQFVCITCAKEFTRVRARGRKPHECPECRGIAQL